MEGLVSTLGGLLAALGNAQAGPVLRERLALALQQAQVADADARRKDQRLAELTQEVVQLRHRAEAAEKELAKYRAPPGETQHRGVRWRREGGRYLPDPYCPRCALAMSEFAGLVICTSCNWEAPFAYRDLPQVRAELPE